MNSKTRLNQSTESTKRTTYRQISWFEKLGRATGERIAAGAFRNYLRAFYRWILWAKTGGKGVQCDFPTGERLRLHPEHRPGWNPIECRAFKKATRPGSIVLDIGANIGTYSLLFGRWTGAKGQVFAFEPASESFAALTQHITLNGLQNVIAPIRDAISDRVGTMHFFASSTRGTNRLISTSESHPSLPTEEIRTLTIDEFCASRDLKPDVIKIDIEGFELAALRGAEKTLRARRSELTLFVEMHPTTWKTLGITRADVEKELVRQGYTAEPLLSLDGDEWKTDGVCMRLIPTP